MICTVCRKVANCVQLFAGFPPYYIIEGLLRGARYALLRAPRFRLRWRLRRRRSVGAAALGAARRLGERDARFQQGARIGNGSNFL